MKNSIHVLLPMCLLAVSPLGATNFSFNGTFSQDDDRAVFWFTTDGLATVTLQTQSYGGGGFDPVLSVFEGFSDPAGFLLALNDDGTCPPGTVDPLTFACADSLLELPLAPGDYTLVLSQTGNLPLGPTFGDGFLQDGQGDYTGPTFLGVPGSFIDPFGTSRTPDWSLEVMGVLNAAPAGGPPTAVPEPGTFALSALAGAGALVSGLSRRKR